MPARPLVTGKYGSHAARHAAQLNSRNAIPDDMDRRQPAVVEKEIGAGSAKVIKRKVQLALARAEIKDRIMGPVAECEPEKAKDLGLTMMQANVPKAVRTLVFNIDHGQQREQLVAAMDLLDRVGLGKGPAVVVNTAPIIINMQGPPPWEKAVDVTPKR